MATVIQLLVLFQLLVQLCVGQYQLVRQDPFASLSATLVTKQSAACDGEFAHLRCPAGAQISIQYVNYDRTADLSVCPPDLQYPETPQQGQNCKVEDSVRQIEDLCQGKETCAVQASFQVLGGQRGNRCPTIRRHLELLYKCKPGTFKSKSVCGNDALQLNCDKGQRIAILSGAFASASSAHIYCPVVGFQQDADNYYQPPYRTPPTPELRKCERTPITDKILQQCHGKESCQLLADPALLGIEPCVGLHLYMKTTYACAEMTVFLPEYVSNTTVRDSLDVVRTTTQTTTSTTTTTTTTQSSFVRIPEGSSSFSNIVDYDTYDYQQPYSPGIGSGSWTGGNSGSYSPGTGTVSSYSPGEGMGKDTGYATGYDRSDSYSPDDLPFEPRGRIPGPPDLWLLNPPSSAHSDVITTTSTNSFPEVDSASVEASGGVIENFPVVEITSGILNNLSFLKKHKMEVILCFVLAAVFGIILFCIILIIKHFRKPSNEAAKPSCTDLDTVDVDAELEIVPTSPLPEPQFLSNPDSTPVKYPTLGRSSVRKTRNSCSDYGYTTHNTAMSPRDQVIRYSTIGRQKVSPGGLSPNAQMAAGGGFPIYAPGSTYSSGGGSNHSYSVFSSDHDNPRSLTLSHQSELPLYD